MNPDLIGDTKNEIAVSPEKVASLLAPCWVKQLCQ